MLYFHIHGIEMSSISLLASLLQDYKSSSASPSQATQPDIAKPALGNNDSSAHGEAYVLDLSQAAQDILSKSNSSGITKTISLTESQRKKLTEILEKYKDAPINNSTLSALNADLEKAGLAPEQLAAIQQAKDFNPLEVLLQLLSQDAQDSNSATDDVLSGLGSPSSGSPIGDLLEQYVANLQKTEAENSTSA